MYEMHSNYRLLTFSDNFMFSYRTQKSVFEFHRRKGKGGFKSKQKISRHPK